MEEIMQYKYDYVEGFCTPSHYYCLMPIEYEWNGKEYHKKRMVCSLVKSGKCDKQCECTHFINAAEIVVDTRVMLNRI